MSLAPTLVHFLRNTTESRRIIIPPAAESTAACISYHVELPRLGKSPARSKHCFRQHAHLSNCRLRDKKRRRYAHSSNGAHDTSWTARPKEKKKSKYRAWNHRLPCAIPFAWWVRHMEVSPERLSHNNKKPIFVYT